MQLGQSHGTTPDYDYYAAANAAGQSAPAQGGAAAQRGGWGTTNQFGSPTAATATYAHTPTVSPRRGGVSPLKVVRVLAPLGIAVVAGFFGLGQLGFIGAPDLTPPASLGGAPATTDAGQQAVLAMTLQSVRDENPDSDVQGQIYTSSAGEVYVLVQADGRLDVDDELSAAGAEGSVEVGDATCAAATTGSATCVRSSWSRSAVLLAMSTDGEVTPETTAALLAEAWD